MADVGITPAGVRNDLVACCRAAAEWRLHRAAAFPRNGRDLVAADVLEATADSLAGLPVDDPRLRRLASAWTRLGEDGRQLAYTAKRRLVGQHGYDGEERSGALLAELIRVMEAAITEERRRPMCGSPSN
jgi:hypothetical protein